MSPCQVGRAAVSSKRRDAMPRTLELSAWAVELHMHGRPRCRLFSCGAWLQLQGRCVLVQAEPWRRCVIRLAYDSMQCELVARAAAYIRPTPAASRCCYEGWLPGAPALRLARPARRMSDKPATPLGTGGPGWPLPESCSRSLANRTWPPGNRQATILQRGLHLRARQRGAQVSCQPGSYQNK